MATAAPSASARASRRVLTFPPPHKALVKRGKLRAWGHVLRIEAGRIWVVLDADATWTFGDDVELTLHEALGPPIGMCGIVTWVGHEAIGIDVQRHAVDLDLTRSWAEGRDAEVAARSAA